VCSKKDEAMVLLDFETKIGELLDQIRKAKEIGEQSNVDVSKTLEELENKLNLARKEIYENLTPWQRVQVSRHPERPYTLEYIEYLTKGDFIELHGDRTIKDDKAIVGGFGMLDGQSVMFIGHQKGTTTKLRQYRNFGMANPEGYRKALRLMRLAEKFNKPIVTFLDTMGAYPGLEAEERGQGEAIARNIYEMFNIRVPIVTIVIGEGASGGAIGIGVGDKVFMLENTWYSVISPESCSQILWRTWDYKEEAASALKLTAKDMYEQGLIDGIIYEPLGGAHANREEILESVKQVIVENLAILKTIPSDDLINQRIEKYVAMGKFIED
jgi:acetyl-CoA carboxylase carboxyl transferase subunit alpha